MMSSSERRQERFSASGLLFVLLALWLTGCGGAAAKPDSPNSNTIAMPSSVSTPTPTPATPSSVSASSEPPPSAMPDMIGKTFQDALTILAPFNVRITQHFKVASQQVGTIIEQDPVGGADFSQDVTLVISAAPATVPNVVGSSLGDAQQKLQSLNLNVVEVPNFDDPRPDGLVIAQIPPGGTANAGEVRLTVVRRPVDTYLSDLEAVSNSNAYNFDVGSAKANGINYSHAVSFQVSRSTAASVEYDLSRDYRRLVGAIAFSDTSSSEAKYRVEDYGDGRQLYSGPITFGTTQTVKLDVTKILRLRLLVTDESGPVNDGTTSDIVFGDIKTQGLQSEVPEPSTSPTP